MNVITYASLIYLNLSMQAKQRTSVENVADVLEAYARAALSAPPATGVPSPEPMAEVISDGVMFLRKQPDGSPWPRGTKLYATPPASEQQQAVVMPEPFMFVKLHAGDVMDWTQDPCLAEYWAEEGDTVAELYSGHDLRLSQHLQPAAPSQGGE